MSEENTNTGFSVSDIIAEVTAEENPASPTDTPVQDAAAPSDTPNTEPVSATPPQEPAKDWWDTSDLDEKAASRIKEIQRQYNTVSETKAAMEREVQRLTDTFKQINVEVEKYLQDPELYRQARVQRGYAQDGQDLTKPTPIPEPDLNVEAIQDIPSLLKEVKKAVSTAVLAERAKHEQAIQDAVAKAELRFRNEANSALEPHYVEKWKSAVSDLTKQYDKSFAEVEAEVRRAILTDPSLEGIRQAYTSKQLSEKQALEQAFKIRYEDRWLEHQFNQRLAKDNKAKETSTEPKTTRTAKKSPNLSKTIKGNALAMSIIQETDAENS